jgi:hypothetical protein
MTTKTRWEPPASIPKDELVRTSEEVLDMPEVEWDAQEDIVRINVAGMDWDIGCKVYSPRGPITKGADGKKAGLFILHGGQADHRYFEPIAPLLAGKFGFKVVCMTFPGRLYLLDPSRNWPGDTINPDGTARTPIWNAETLISPDQYELIQDRSNPSRRSVFRVFAPSGSATPFFRWIRTSAVNMPRASGPLRPLHRSPPGLGPRTPCSAYRFGAVGVNPCHDDTS